MHWIVVFAAISFTAGCGTTEPKNNPNGEPSGSAMCDDYSDLVAEAQSGCTDDAECEARSGKCGCPLAVRSASDQTAIDEVLDTCDFSETCSLIDCAQRGQAVCTDGRCAIN